MARTLPLFAAGTFTAGATETVNLKPGESFGLQVTTQDTTPAALAFTAATTDICTKTAHGMVLGLPVVASTTGTLPAGLSATTYFVVPLTADTFSLAATRADAIAVPPVVVDITSTGSGVHTLTPTVGGARTFIPSISLDGINFVSVFQVDGAAAVTLASVTMSASAVSKMYQFSGVHGIRSVRVVMALVDGQAAVSGVISISK